MNCEEFITYTLELIQNGKIVSLGLNVDVPIELYGDNIISLLKEIPEEYKKDNCKKLFELIKEDLNKSIEEITEKSKQLYNLYSKIELLPENEIEDLEKSIERDGNNQIQIYLDNESKKIYSCYTLNNKILECVKELNLIDECIKTLKGENGNTNDDDLSLEITNFPRLTQNNPQINNINNYFEINKYFENEDKKKKNYK